MKLTIFAASLFSLVALATVGCSTESSNGNADESGDSATLIQAPAGEEENTTESTPSTSTENSTVSITDEEIYDEVRKNLVFVANPRLSPNINTKTFWEDKGQKNIFVKDADGRIFIVSMYSSAADASTGALPPPSDDVRYFLVLNDTGFDWLIANHPKAPNRRHAEILGLRENANAETPVAELGTTDSGETILHFNATLYFVAPEGFDERCKSTEEDCSAAWQRVVSSVDRDDVQ